ncbi:MAG: acylphosphatase [Candidatus Limnocylindrales bacterium]
MTADPPGVGGTEDSGGLRDLGGPGARARLEASVRGRVQGVGYRVFALREAGSLGLDGFVANEADGNVRVVAEGRRTDLEALVVRLEAGPPAGFVDRVVTRWEPARGIGRGFRIESGAHRGD